MHDASVQYVGSMMTMSSSTNVHFLPHEMVYIHSARTYGRSGDLDLCRTLQLTG